MPTQAFNPARRRVANFVAALLPFACLFWHGQSHAANNAITEQEYLQDLPVVLSASRLRQPVSETPTAVTVIDREMIKASGFRNIPDLFRLAPGMFVDNFDGHMPIVAYHGSTDEYSRRMQVLVDGRSVYLPPFSNVDWQDIPLHIDDIERIEVVRGPAAASHGANSFQGVINIITRDAGSVQGASVSVAKGGGGVSDVAAHLGKSGAQLDYRLTVGYRADNGLDTPVVNDNKTARLANLRANYRPNASDSIDFQLGYNEGVYGMGIAGRPTDPFRDATTYSSFEQVTWLRALPQGDELKVQYFHIYHRTTKIAYPTDVTTVQRNDLELQHTTHLGANHRLVWGGGTRTDSTDSPLNLAAPVELEQWRAFAHDEWRVSQNALLNVGAMFEKDGFGHANTSPRISFNYHLAPQHTIRVGASVAYRSPAVLEEKGYTPEYFQAAGGLRPERIRSREIGYLGEFGRPGLSIDARLFRDEIRDVIYLDPLAQPDLGARPYNFRNLLAITQHGFETTLKYRWQERSSVIFNYARQVVDCSITGSLTRQLAPLQNLLRSMVNTCAAIGEWSGNSILLTQQLGHDMQFSAGYYHQHPLPILNTSEATVMRRVDLRLAKSLAKSAFYSGGEIAVVVQNAFQSDYAEYSTVPQTNFVKLFNKRAFVTASLNF